MDTAQNKLVMNNIGLAHYWSNRYQSIEDRDSIAYMALIEAVQAWKPEKCKLGSLVAFYCRNAFTKERLNQTIRQPMLVKDRRDYKYSSLDVPLDDDFTLHDVIPDKADCGYSEIFDIVKKHCNKREVEYLSLYFIDGYSLSEIGTQSGVTRSRAGQIINTALNKLRKHLQDYVRG